MKPIHAVMACHALLLAVWGFYALHMMVAK